MRAVALLGFLIPLLAPLCLSCFFSFLLFFPSAILCSATLATIFRSSLSAILSGFRRFRLARGALLPSRAIMRAIGERTLLLAALRDFARAISIPRRVMACLHADPRYRARSSREDSMGRSQMLVRA